MEFDLLLEFRAAAMHTSAWFTPPVDQLHASENMHGMSDVTFRCSFAACKVL